MWYRSLGFKLICSVGAIAVLVFGVYASVSVETQRDQLIQEVIRSTNLVSETIKRSMREDMLTPQPGRLRRAIDTIGAQEGIEKVRIFNYVGEIITHLIGKRWERWWTSRRSSATPVMHGNSPSSGSPRHHEAASSRERPAIGCWG